MGFTEHNYQLKAFRAKTRHFIEIQISRGTIFGTRRTPDSFKNVAEIVNPEDWALLKRPQQPFVHLNIHSLQHYSA